MSAQPQVIGNRSFVGSGESVLTNPNAVSFNYRSIEEAFPAVDPGVKPYGSVGLFQIRLPMRRTAGGIILTDEDKANEYYNTQVGKVIALGGMAFKRRVIEEDPKTGKCTEAIVAYSDGAWFQMGDYVRLPRYGGDRFTVTHEYKDFDVDPATRRQESVTLRIDVIFALFKVHEILGHIRDPLTIKAFLDH